MLNVGPSSQQAHEVVPGIQKPSSHGFRPPRAASASAHASAACPKRVPQGTTLRKARTGHCCGSGVTVSARAPLTAGSLWNK
jgi:hypothetical protein